MHPEAASAREITGIIGEVPRGRHDLVIPTLQRVQATLGYIPEQVVFDLAGQVGTTPAAVFGVATFYNQFRLTAPGTHTIRVCRGTACHVKGSARILDTICRALGVASGETTRDGLFTVEEVACLGSCSIAPAVMIDDRFYGHVTAEGLVELAEAISRGGDA